MFACARMYIIYPYCSYTSVCERVRSVLRLPTACDNLRDILYTLCTNNNIISSEWVSAAVVATLYASAAVLFNLLFIIIQRSYSATDY